MSMTTTMLAIKRAMDEELDRDKNVFLIGEDIGISGGCFGVTNGLFAKHGGERIIDTPISEAGYTAIAFGAALRGKRPVVEMMFGEFIALAYDTIANNIAQMTYLTAGKTAVPMVIRCAHAVMGGGGASLQHSQDISSWFMNIPGLKIVCPSTADEHYALLKASIRDDNPVLFLEHKRSYMSKGEVPDEEHVMEIGKAKIVKEGTDVTVIANQQTRVFAEQVIPELEKEGISVELIDPLTIKPYDKDTMVASAKKTGRVVICTESRQTGSYATEFSHVITEECFAELKKPVARVCGVDVPICKGPEEAFIVPSAEEIANAIRNIVK